MKLLSLSWSSVVGIGVVVVSFATPILAQNATASSKQAQLARALALLQTMPQCALTCLTAAVAASGIPAADIDLTASCSNTTATEGIERCAKQSCTIREQLTAKNVTETLCSRPIRHVPSSPVSTNVGASIATAAYFMRMASKVYFPCETGARVDTDFWWDDAAITFAFLLMIPISVLSTVLAQLGIGRDVWTIPHENITQALKASVPRTEESSIQSILTVHQIYYFDEMMYVVALPTIKIAILLTYLRIFQSKRFRQLVFGALGLNLGYMIAFVLATAFQCRPLNMAWYRWDKSHPGSCNNINAQGWASAAINIFLDVIVVGLPMPMLWRMNLNKRKKVLVMLMFGVGFFVTFVSILRLQMLVKFGNSQNITYDYKKVGYWTIIELHTALACACMPGIRNLIRRAFPKIMGQTTASASSKKTPTTGLSGRTAVSSGVDKDGVEVYVRPRHSDDRDFIPLESVSTQNLNETAKAPVGDAHLRSFSRPDSPPESAWYDHSGEKSQRSVSPA